MREWFAVVSALCPPAEFKQAFCARVRAAREACDMTQVEIARRLEISRGAYQKYESRTLLPYHLVEQFAAITGVEIKQLFGVVEK
jgi:transcriptional regulator with XRE-family HTH domain